jgi:predicted nucleic acid-binding protein
VKILFDTNIVLDLLMDRLPYADDAAALFSRVENGTVMGYLCATTLTTVYYIAAKTVGTVKAQEQIRKLLTLFEVAPVNRSVIESALDLGFADFEDAVLHGAACHVGADAIVTRNQKDFKKARISAYSPGEAVKITSCS